MLVADEVCQRLLKIPGIRGIFWDLSSSDSGGCRANFHGCRLALAAFFSFVPTQCSSGDKINGYSVDSH